MAARLLALLAAALLLTGCASTFLLENVVRSFSSLPALPANTAYRFERLPSQQSPQQAVIEALADPALFKAGLKRDDAAPQFSVQVGAQVQRVLSRFADPWDGWGGLGALPPSPHFGSLFGRMEQPYFKRQVSVIVRELASSKVVFESHAFNDGPWSDNTAVVSALFEAALQGFPNPPAGPRKVNINVPTR